VTIPVSIIIPAYNEDKGIKQTLDEILSFARRELKNYQIIVVDDCSEDNTNTILKESKEIMLLKNPTNIGYGGSIKAALSRARYNHILIIDADGTYPADEISKLLPFADDFDMVIGARSGRHYRGTFFKNLSRKIFYILVKYVTGEKIPDVNSGLRIFKKDKIIKFYDRLCNGFSFTTTITIALISTGHLVKHVNIDYRKRIGKSKVRFLRDSLRTLQILVESIAYFNPIKAFLPLLVGSAFLSFYFVLGYLFTEISAYLISASIFIFAAFLFFALGMLTYIVTKTKNNE